MQEVKQINLTIGTSLGSVLSGMSTDDLKYLLDLRNKEIAEIHKEIAERDSIGRIDKIKDAANNRTGVRELRRALGVTMEELAGMVGVTKGSINSYEKNRMTPKDNILMKFQEISDNNGIGIKFTLKHKE